MEKPPLTTGEIAGYCHVSHRTVLKWITAGKLKAYRTPGQHSRISIEDFLKFLSAYHMPIPAELQPNGNKKRILIVDDEREIVQSIKRVLTMAGKFEIETAHDGFEAGRKFAEFKPALVLLDIKMPGLNGYELCSHIRKNPENRNVKILLISGIVDPNEMRQIEKCGADDYLAKPFDNKDLKIKILSLFGQNKMEG